jgi:NAD(P)-dependent dehydrogenase (short-subunit alcohol dehydrogenase family)
MKKLEGKVALITAAARGIGEAIARAFVEEGGCLYLSDINDELGADTANRLGKSAKYIRLDVRKDQDWASVTNYLIGVHGGIDVVVNNAGITGFESGDLVQDPENASLEAWWRCARSFSVRRSCFCSGYKKWTVALAVGNRLRSCGCRGVTNS